MDSVFDLDQLLNSDGDDFVELLNHVPSVSNSDLTATAPSPCEETNFVSQLPDVSNIMSECWDDSHNENGNAKSRPIVKKNNKRKRNQKRNQMTIATRYHHIENEAFKNLCGLIGFTYTIDKRGYGNISPRKIIDVFDMIIRDGCVIDDNTRQILFHVSKLLYRSCSLRTLNFDKTEDTGHKIHRIAIMTINEMIIKMIRLV